MRKCIFLLLILPLAACEGKEEPKYYSTRLYPAHREEYTWEENAFFIDIPISLRLESRINYEDKTWEGRFEPIKVTGAELFMDRDLVFEGDTIPKMHNLFADSLAKIEMLTVPRNGDHVSDSYILWINKENDPGFANNRGYFTVYFKCDTENGYSINDSTVIYVE